MRQIRSYIDQPLEVGMRVRLSVDASLHLLRVLRLGVGDRITLFNGDGSDYDAVLLTAARSGAEVDVQAVRLIDSESSLRIHLAQALARGDKMDWVLQKATELGVHAITPLLTHRSEVKLSGDRLDKRMLHWRGVISSACEQCGRARLPDLGLPQRLGEWCAGIADGQRWFLDPSASQGLNHVEPGLEPIALVIGPEGGLDERDVATLHGAGFHGLRLGPRILRTETAGLAVIAALQARLGDLIGTD